MMKKTFSLVALVFVLASCSHTQSAPERPAQISGAPASVADVQFAQAISQNQVKVIQVSQFAQRNSKNTELITFAAGMTKSKEDETASLLKIFDPGTNHNQSSVALKALDDAHVLELWNARGAKFDKLFVAAMIAHYREAITVAQTELYSGTNTAAIALANEVITSRTKSINQLLALQKKI
jgi:uncharacterized protein (DUF305 family)